MSDLLIRTQRISVVVNTVKKELVLNTLATYISRKIIASLKEHLIIANERFLVNYKP